MALPSNWDLIPIKAIFVDSSGAPIKGKVKFTPKATRMVSISHLTTVIGRTVVATLDATGSLLISLPATDDTDVTPNGFTYLVEEDFVGGGGQSYAISVPLSAVEDGVDLSIVAPVSPNVGAGPSPITRLEFDALKAEVEAGGGGSGGGVSDYNDLTNKPFIPTTAADVEAVPETRTVAGKPLSADVILAKADVGLGSVDNTSDAAKPVSTATQAALNAKVDSTRTVAGKALSANVTLVKGDVGLANVDNTADSAKPISTATQTALNAKVDTTRTVAGKPLTSDITLAKGDVGLGSVDNTADLAKPISTATQTALNAKVDSTRTVAGKALSANVTLVKADVGLGSVDNTADSAKPISTLTQTALDAKLAAAEFIKYGVRPTIRWSGMAWPTKASALPTGYTGAIIWDSSSDVAATAPTEAASGDFWDKRVA